MAQPDKKPATPKAEPTAARPAARKAAGPATSPETESLLGLIDKLSSLLEKSELSELEVEAGETGIVLRKPGALAPASGPVVTPEHSAVTITPSAPAAAPDPVPPTPTARAVRAPLTGVFYAAPSPAAPPYVTVGQQVAVGQVIGLIEAMKLFNEIKSDVSGAVVRIVAESGKLVKAKQPLIEVEP